MKGHKIIKTLEPNQFPCECIVTQPSGDMPYHLVSLPESEIERLNLQDDVVEDTAAFLSQFNLSEPEQ